MFWTSPKKKRHEDSDEHRRGELTVGQRLDVGEAVMEPFNKAMTGSPFNMMTLAAAAVDVSVSSANAPHGKTVSAAGAAVAAQTGGMAGYFAGKTVGALVGGLVLPFGGEVVGEFVGGAVGAMMGDKIGRQTVGRIISRTTGVDRVQFGSFKDSQPAYTMRQRSEQELTGSLLNARRYLGREGQLMHQ